MTTSRPLPDPVRKALPWIAGWLGANGVLALAGWITARRSDDGDESSLGIRRTVAYHGLELRPRNPQLSRVRVDLAVAGAEIDLTGIPQPATGIDLTVNLLKGGMAVRVPAGWRVWWQFRGLGGIGTDGAVQRTSDPHGADLRIHCTALFGGIGITGSGS